MLRNKIFSLMVAVGIVPIVVAAVVTVYVVRDSHRDDVAKLEAAVLTQKGDEVQNFIDQGLLAQTRVLTPNGPNIGVATSAQQYVLSQTLQALPFLQSESFVNLSGQETARADRNHLNGYSSTSTDGGLRDLSGTPQFQSVSSGGYYIGPVSYTDGGAGAGGVPTITFASPVKDSNGRLLAIVAGVASLTPLQSIIEQGKIGATGYLYLVDWNGAMIAGGGGFAGQSGTSSAANLPIVKSALAGQTLLTPETQMRYKNTFGNDVVAAAMPLPEYGTRWGLIAEWPTAESDAVINALLLRDALVLIGVLALIIILSIISALYIVRPIKKLEEGTRRVAEGKFNEGVNITTGDELEELGDSFNQMVLGLKQLEALKDEFVFIAAHELKTPVAAMKGYLSLILDGTTGTITDGTRAFIEKVVASDNRLVQLVNDLLEVARSQAGRLTIKVAPIALPPPIKNTLDEVRSLADEKSVKMVYAVPSDLPNVLADAERIKEVMVNLVGNAIKYGAKTITITHERVDNDVVTHVADDGFGMSPTAVAKLFEKFYRVQTDKTKDIQGTGLGLFIVRQIIEKMNGKIWVISEEGKGSTFSFSLPVA